MHETTTVGIPATEEPGLTTEQLVARAKEWKTLTPEQRAARLKAACGLFAGGDRTLDDFLREKHEEIDRTLLSGKPPAG